MTGKSSVCCDASSPQEAPSKRTPCADREAARSLGVMNPGREESTVAEFEGEASPLSDHVAIVRFPARGDRHIARSVGAQESLIKLLRRARPIADVLTDKLDVREIAAALSKFVPLAVEDEVDKPPDTDGATTLDDERLQFEVVG